ncbi:MAG: thioredoxin domain-containing protein [Desulfobacterales bacterium]
MHQTIRHPRLKKTFGAFIIMVIALLFTTGTGLCQSSGQTVEEKYPGLVSGVLKNARLEPMDKQILLKSDAVTIHRADLTGKLKDLDDRRRSQLKKNLLFLLEQEATRKFLLNKAQKAGLATSEMDEQEVFQTFFDHKTEKMEVTEKEARDFYQDNKDMVRDMPFEQVKDSIRDYLIQEKKQQFIQDYIQGIADDVELRVNKQWVEDKSRLAMDNPVDKSRNSGLPTMVEFGAEGCEPCDRMQPILEQLRKDFADALNVVFVNVKEAQMLAARFGVQSIPVQVFYDADGKEVFRHTGFLSRDKVYSKLAEMGVGQKSEAMFTRGSGPVEVLLFTDYFCPPCRRLEPYLEETLPELISSGVKVTFVDAAFNQKSSLYARYFLYAANSASSLESFIHARSVLFELAENSGIESERELLQALKEKNVDIKLFDTQPLMDEWKEIIEKHNLRSTPTCVIIKPGQEPEQHRGGKAIPEALDRLLAEVSQKQSKVSD